MQEKIPDIIIGNRTISRNGPCFIIAEAGVNHNGNISIAKKLVNAAAAAGADAVKFQTFTAETLVTRAAEKAQYQKQTTIRSESQFQMLKKLELKPADYQILIDYAHRKGIEFLSTPFDVDSVDLLDDLGVSAFKISSGDLTNLPLLKYAAAKKKPLLISTGMGTLGEIEESVKFLEKNQASEIVLFHCTTSYPAPLESVNIRFIGTLQKTFGKLVGYSDHTLGIIAPLIAVGMGACVIEKHFTLNKYQVGPDHRASAEPQELKEMVTAVHATEVAMGNGIRQLSEEEEAIKLVARKSLVAARSLKPGDIITPDMVTVKRPATGIEPKHLFSVIGKKVTIRIPRDTVLTWDMIR